MNYGTIMHNASYSIALYETTNASLWYYTSIIPLLILWLANHCNVAFLLPRFFRSKQKFFRFFVFLGQLLSWWVHISRITSSDSWLIVLLKWPWKSATDIWIALSHSPANCCWTKCCCCCCNNANDCCCPWLAAAEAAAPAMAWLR